MDLLAKEEVARLQASKTKLKSEAARVNAILEQGRLALKDNSKLFLFRGMIKELKSHYTEFNSTWDGLIEFGFLTDLSSSVPSEAEKALRESIDNHYYEACAIHEQLTNPLPAAMSATHVGLNTALNDSRAVRARLPEINLPRFDGSYADWPLFRDTFTSLIHDEPTLSQIEKFHFLLSSLKGPALALVKGVAISEETYPQAWRLLKDNYDDKRRLASSFLKTILHFAPFRTRPTANSIKFLLSTAFEAASSFKQLKVPKADDFVLFILLLRLLDPQTRKDFERSHSKEDYPAVSSLEDFLKSELRSLELTSEDAPGPSTQTPSSHVRISSPPPRASHSRSSLFSGYESSGHSDHSNSSQRSGYSKSVVRKKSAGSYRCPVCRASHTLYQCSKFKSSSPQERLRLLKNWKGCTNCLSSNHKAPQCTSTRSCQTCGLKHHSWLHTEKAIQPNKPDAAKPESDSNEEKGPSAAYGSTSCSGEAILGTALVDMKDQNGRYQPIRAVVDCGSQHSFITTSCAQRLGFKPRRTSVSIAGIGKTPLTRTDGEVDCVLRSRYGNHRFFTTAVAVPEISDDLPYSPIAPEFRQLTAPFHLADPMFWKPQRIDFLLGADLYFNIITGGPIELKPRFPMLIPSRLGHIVAGGCMVDIPARSSGVFFARSHPGVKELATTMQKFWEIEEVHKDIPMSIEEAACESHFSSTHYRLPSGRYVVALPFKETIGQLRTPLQQVEGRFKKLEYRLGRDPSLKAQYHDFMREYIQLDHMSAAKYGGRYHIPHHCVTKMSGEELKLRVVFDASCQGSHGSLNTHLMTGPKLQRDICDIVLKFRVWKVVFVADIVKMYRQVLVRPEDRAFQRILWRFDPLQPVQEYELHTVTYGIASSAFLAIRALQQLARDDGKDYPLASKTLMSDVYVDDIVTGADTLDQALQLQSELVQLLRKGCFELSKWKSNRQELLEIAQGDSLEKSFLLEPSDDRAGCRVLGLKWTPSSDTFSFEIQPPSAPSTKRGILSTIARIFDPLGYLAPVVFHAKTILQEVWKDKCGWDDSVPERLRTRWESFGGRLSDLSRVKIPRHVAPREGHNFILGFADASQLGYAAALYLHNRTSAGQHTYLLKAKTKLAPTKLTSIPRLELCAALLLSRLLQSCSDFISQVKPETILLFTDSSVVLGWLSTPANRLKAFVAHRVTEIIELTPSATWNHVDSGSNPADCASRGLLPHELPGHSLWWSGPDWLSNPVSDWPRRFKVSPLQELPELKPADAMCLLASPIPSISDWMAGVSSYLKIIRCTAWLYRFIRRSQRVPTPSGPLTLKEIRDANFVCIMLIQREHLPALEKMQTSKPWKSFSPFRDSLGLVRVGGRLRNSNLSYDAKHPIILPRCRFARLLVDHFHRTHLHIGPTSLQATIQRQYCILSARRIIRSCVRQCTICQRAKPVSQPPLMGDLPPCRFQEGHAFLNVGVDLGGPFPLKESNRRKAALGKSYLALFICLSTKAVHLEVVTSCSTEAFLAALNRFVARRGKPLNIYSDCGTNFIGAKRELGKWYQAPETQNSIQTSSAAMEITWHNIPPRAPHFGGIWEAGIKSAKALLAKNLAHTALTFEELSTVFCRIEAVLNSRPISPLSDDSELLECLTPGHFLIGRPLSAIPEQPLLDCKENCLRRWELVQQRVQHFWSRWRLEYLNQIQQRRKWTTRSPSLAEGDLVILKDSDAPPASWPLARVLQTHPGEDGVVRVATIRTSTGVYKRPVIKLVPLRLPQDELQD